ncbi:hypothetical protein BGW36DRAFT_362901 [Talaromyces proteolyticus]|uniref:Uncharacterized protein n=1 Tax=Talaromyces proteolyticus TaxID=1131652 RepID=A0AAD4PSQ5_9EURO|nr:uncharacterized protein BGW36DRAFT_362901 [Talaromyces proteolyticus]KAH8691871.1 hypothetical protein BGW36DRAFT_362901 [Talaromyces proteolyticus]
MTLSHISTQDLQREVRKYSHGVYPKDVEIQRQWLPQGISESYTRRVSIRAERDPDLIFDVYFDGSFHSQHHDMIEAYKEIAENLPKLSSRMSFKETFLSFYSHYMGGIWSKWSDLTVFFLTFFGELNCADELTPLLSNSEGLECGFQQDSWSIMDRNEIGEDAELNNIQPDIELELV